MRRNDELENRLVEWSQEYGGGKYENIGWPGKSPLHSMMKWNGRPPQGLGCDRGTTRADMVQTAVDSLHKADSGPLLVAVLSVEYLTPGLAIDSRLQRLRKTGHNLAKSQYYARLRQAREWVALQLGIVMVIEDDEPVDLDRLANDIVRRAEALLSA